MNSHRKHKYVPRKWFFDKPHILGRALWIFSSMVAMILSASCRSEESGGFGGQGGNGGAECLAGACEVRRNDAVDDSSKRVAGNADETDALDLPANAIACTQDVQCASGFCTDGFCCDRRCDDTCMACSVAKQGQGVDGICGPIKNDTDPDDECWGGACDGSYVCKLYNGESCTLWSQCLSNYCVDGVCCNNYCDGECSACTIAKKGDGTPDGLCGNIKVGTDPDNECNPGACHGTGTCSSPQAKLPLGSSCISAAQCSSGQCADGVCCDFLCVDRECQACTAAKKGSGVDGICGPIKYDTDPDNECWGGGCNGSGDCKRYINQPCSFTSQCLSDYCVDGVCCNNHCMDGCYACTAAKTGIQDGVCGPIKTGTDPDNECNSGECTATHTCSAPQTPQPPGTPCTGAAQCASGFCADGVCCDEWCLGECKACTVAKKGYGSDGQCGFVQLDLDTENECNGGVCDGQGQCRHTNGAPCTSSDQCFSTYCVDGVCCGNICDQVCETCMASKKSSGPDGQCGPIAIYTDPDNECLDPAQCNGAKACGLPDGVACTVSSACISGNCVDGVCCNSTCGGGATNDCQACNVAGSVGACKALPAGQTCRSVANTCDVVEVCDGSAFTCPTDKYAPAGTACRPATDVCDNAETCTGASPACPPDIVTPAGTTCRPSVDICDVAEACNGSAKTCPTNGFVPSGTICRSATLACDTAESCTGSGPVCPPDIVKPVGAVCRDKVGDCDVAETCNGSAKTCPTDGFVSSATVCRPSAGDCDLAENCTGSSALCPNDSMKSPATVCRVAAGSCDVAESCDGSNPTCPTNQYATAGTICGAEFCSSSLVRNNLDACDGAGTCFDGGSLKCSGGCFGSQCYGGHAIQPIPGIWHNPARPGWSVHVSRNVSGTVALSWLTYRPDGTPVWYIAATEENDGKFATTMLYNTQWVNNKAVIVPHGSMTFTTASASSGVLSWVLDGVAWQEPIQLYVFDKTGISPNITGTWYDTNQPGWGIMNTVQGDSLVPAVGVYDMSGQPTWVYHSGGGAWTGSAFNATLAQRTGVNLCPGCAGPTSYSSVDVGSIQIRNIYDSSGGNGLPNAATLDMSYFANGLSQWNRSGVAITLLTF